jgi:uncharacterized protein (TIGR03067 family)
MTHAAILTAAILCGFGVEARSKTDDADAKSLAIAAEHKKFEGTWRFASFEMEGVAAPEDSLKDMRMTLKGDQFLAGENGSVKGTYAIDPTVKPKTIDVIFTLPEGKKQTLLGIYELEGDTYKVSLGTPGKPRPTEFASKPGSGNAVEILKRIKP